MSATPRHVEVPAGTAGQFARSGVRLQDPVIGSTLRVERDLLRLEPRVEQLEATVASMCARLAEHRRRTGTRSQPLERAVGEFSAEVADVRDWLDGAQCQTAAERDG